MANVWSYSCNTPSVITWSCQDLEIWLARRTLTWTSAYYTCPEFFLIVRRWASKQAASGVMTSCAEEVFGLSNAALGVYLHSHTMYAAIITRLRSEVVWCLSTILTISLDLHKKVTGDEVIRYFITQDDNNSLFFTLFPMTRSCLEKKRCSLLLISKATNQIIDLFLFII